MITPEKHVVPYVGSSSPHMIERSIHHREMLRTPSHALTVRMQADIEEKDLKWVFLNLQNTQ